MVQFLGWEDPLEKGIAPLFLGIPCGSAGKEYACNAGDLGSIPGLESFPGEGKGYPLQCSCLENSRDGEPGGLPSMGSHRVGHRSDLAAAAAYCIGVFLSGLLHSI